MYLVTSKGAKILGYQEQIKNYKDKDMAFQQNINELINEMADLKISFQYPISTELKGWKNENNGISTTEKDKINELKNDKNLKLECSSALAYFLYLYVYKYHPNLYNELSDVFISGNYLLDSKVYKECFLTGKIDYLVDLSLEEQENFVKEKLKPGSHVYIRGCIFWIFTDQVPELLDYTTSYQGENTIYLGDDKFLSFWRDGDIGSYKVVSFKEIVVTLYLRSKNELEKMPRHVRRKLKKELKKFKYVQHSKGIISKYPDLLSVVGIESAVELVLKDFEDKE